MQHKTIAQAASNGRADIVYPIAAYSLWGILPIYWKVMKQLPAGDILAHRIFWSFLFLAVIISGMRRWKEFRQAFTSIRSLLTISVAAILISVNWLIYIWAVNNNHIVEASLGYYINPLLTILLGVVVLHERSDVWQIVAIALAFVGVALLTYQFGEVPWVAVSLAVSFALYGLVKKLSKLSPLTGLAAETMMVTPLALGYLYMQVSGTVNNYSSISYGMSIMILLTGVVTSIPLLLFAQGAKRVSLTTMGFVQYLSPSLSLLIGIFIYKEPFTLAYQISFGLIWVALAIYSFSRKEVLSKLKISK
ncbi:EamA family transporter RarD [uncultured Acetobacteroides sp.]|uniref:EamA family transporter RarD n=1 Tax=uncultured Acetobacteroides sp. TaxID=1760811 RepID=UPI0029F484F5|nr:EamA family transporter RarD [uncultured Acetobacteroides sp.]